MTKARKYIPKEVWDSFCDRIIHEQDLLLMRIQGLIGEQLDGTSDTSYYYQEIRKRYQYLSGIIDGRSEFMEQIEDLFVKKK